MGRILEWTRQDIPQVSIFTGFPSSVWWTIALSIHKRTGLDCKVANLNADMAAQISAWRLVCWVKTLFTSPSVLPKLHTIILVRMLTYLYNLAVLTKTIRLISSRCIKASDGASLGLFRAPQHWSIRGPRSQSPRLGFSGNHGSGWLTTINRMPVMINGLDTDGLWWLMIVDNDQ